MIRFRRYQIGIMVCFRDHGKFEGSQCILGIIEYYRDHGIQGSQRFFKGFRCIIGIMKY